MGEPLSKIQFIHQWDKQWRRRWRWRWLLLITCLTTCGQTFSKHSGVFVTHYYLRIPSHTDNFLRNDCVMWTIWFLLAVYPTQGQVQEGALIKGVSWGVYHCIRTFDNITLLH